MPVQSFFLDNSCPVVRYKLAILWSSDPQTIVNLTGNLYFPTLIGADAWPGKQMHSHNYRLPEPFLDQVSMILTMIYSPLMSCHAKLS